MNTEQRNIKCLFANKQIIIPDVQRDYCWGADVIEPFLQSLLGSKDNSLMLGMIFGYGEGDDIYLTDGQQRLTTLFLILGVMNRMMGDNSLKNILQNEDGEPRLVYAIRDTSMFFMSDLVDKYFCSPATTRNIKNQSWYVNDYNHDPSVQSMIQAIGLIEKYLVNKPIKECSEFLLEKVEFIYYPMKNQQMSEEAYVVINTTGEPLTDAENYKPHYVSAYHSSAHLWEEIVQYFWQNRANGKNINATADVGMKEFLIWAQSIHEVKIIDKVAIDKLRDIEPDALRSIFNSAKAVFASDLALNKAYLSQQNSRTVRKQIIPLILYHRIFGDVNLKRAWMFFENHIHHEQKNENLLSAVIHMKDADIISIATDVLSEEELYKFKLYRESHQRELLEDICWHAERMELWGGRIMPLLNWAKDGEGLFSFDTLQRLRKVLDILFQNGTNEDSRDELRRALLAKEETRAIFFDDDGKAKRINLGTNLETWGEILSSDKSTAMAGELFKSLPTSEGEITKYLNECIESYKEGEFYPLVRDDLALKKSAYRLIKYQSRNNYCILRFEQDRTAIHIDLISFSQEIGSYIKTQEKSDWEIDWYYSVLYIQNSEKSKVIDIFGNTSTPMFQHSLFQRNGACDIIKPYQEVYSQLSENASLDDLREFVHYLINN